VNVQAILTNPTAGGRDLTVKTSVYLRTGPLPGEAVDPNLVLWWKLDEASGLIAADSSLNGNNGTLTDMAGNEWTSGQVDGALEFDGYNDKVYVADASLYITNEITVSAWVWHDAFRIGELERYLTVRTEIAVIRKKADGRLQFYIKTNGSTRHLQVSDVLVEGQWQHVAGTWDGTTQRLYLDGVEIASQTPGGVLDSVSGNVDLSSGNEPINGRLDDARVYNRALSGTEIGGLCYLAGPVYLGFTEAKLDSDGTSLTISTPSGVVENSLLIAAMATDGDTTSSLAPPAGEGWTQVFCNDQSDQVTIGVWWKLADASESASHEFTWSAGQQAYGWMMRFEGHNPADPIHDYSADGETNASPSSPPVTTTLDKCLILRLGAFDDADITVDDPGLSSHTAITMDASQSPAVSYEEFTEAKASSKTTSLTINTPAGTAEGDLLIAAVVTDGDNKSSLAPPGGENWTEIDIDSRWGTATLGAWWKLADASEPSSHNFTWDDDEEAYGWMMRFTGHDPSNPMRQQAKNEDTSSSPDCDPVTTTVANCLILRLASFDKDKINIDNTGLMNHTTITMDENGGGKGSCSGGAGYQQQAAPGESAFADFNLTASEESVTLTVAIAPATGGTVSGGAGYVTQSSSGSSGSSNFSLTASEEARTVTIAIAPVP